MLDDHSVQQFVNSKTNRPVSFRIEVVDHQNVKLSVIHIDKAQKRPIYLAKNFGALKKEVVYIRRGSSTDMAAPDEIAEMGKEAIQESKPEVSIEFELVIEKWQSSFGPRISEQEMDFLKIYAVNNKGGLAQYLQGYVWIPSVVPHDSRYLATTPDGFAQAEQISLEINNKISENPGSMWHPRSKAEWKPLSPGMRICLQEIRIFAYREMLTTSTASIRWQFSVNGSDSIKGETKFADIPLIDRRNRS